MQKTKNPTKQYDTSRPLVILDKVVTRNQAKRIAAVYGGELPSLKEFIIWLKNPENLKEAKGTEWYWLREKPGLDYDGFCRIDYEKGTLEEIDESVWSKLPEDKKAYSYAEAGNLRLAVGEMDNRLGLYAADMPGYKGRVAFVKL